MLIHMHSYYYCQSFHAFVTFATAGNACGSSLERKRLQQYGAHKRYILVQSVRARPQAAAFEQLEANVVVRVTKQKVVVRVYIDIHK